jgi:2-polyprenyl-3-methyl-5-hydroxy-6-metoxy-1,4-benzoquinol methylase
MPAGQAIFSAHCDRRIIMGNTRLIAGNEEKYFTKNIVYKYIVGNFIRNVSELALKVRKNISSINEIGCGEGHLAERIGSLGIAPVRGCDVSEDMIRKAIGLHAGGKIDFYVKSVYDLDQADEADLIVCCEVLEHLEDPASALQKLKLISNKYCLLSVPNEPLWRILNCMRGKYLKDFGNTPGHLKHWSFGAFKNLVLGYFNIIEARKVFPWTVILAQKTHPLINKK